MSGPMDGLWHRIEERDRGRLDSPPMLVCPECWPSHEVLPGVRKHGRRFLQTIVTAVASCECYECHWCGQLGESTSSTAADFYNRR